MLWEFIPYDDFDDSVDAMTAIGFLDQSSGLYKKITRYHKVQKRLPGNLKAMQKAGTDVVIVANYGLPNIPINSAYANQTDILIDTKYASVGATTADYGKALKRTGMPMCRRTVLWTPPPVCFPTTPGSLRAWPM